MLLDASADTVLLQEHPVDMFQVECAQPHQMREETGRFLGKQQHDRSQFLFGYPHE
jgi:hypothetical protein